MAKRSHVTFAFSYFAAERKKADLQESLAYLPTVTLKVPALVLHLPGTPTLSRLLK